MIVQQMTYSNIHSLDIVVDSHTQVKQDQLVEIPILFSKKIWLMALWNKADKKRL